MRVKTLLTSALFAKEGETFAPVALPHTWNALDGQDGGDNYYRGTCTYVKTLDKMDLPQTDRYYLEIRGANSSADAYLNGKQFRVTEVDFVKEYFPNIKI